MVHRLPAFGQDLRQDMDFVLECFAQAALMTRVFCGSKDVNCFEEWLEVCVCVSVVVHLLGFALQILSLRINTQIPVLHILIG